MCDSRRRVMSTPGGGEEGDAAADIRVSGGRGGRGWPRLTLVRVDQERRARRARREPMLLEEPLQRARIPRHPAAVSMAAQRLKLIDALKPNPVRWADNWTEGQGLAAGERVRVRYARCRRPRKRIIATGPWKCNMYKQRAKKEREAGSKVRTKYEGRSMCSNVSSAEGTSKLKEEKAILEPRGSRHSHQSVSLGKLAGTKYHPGCETRRSDTRTGKNDRRD